MKATVKAFSRRRPIVDTRDLTARLDLRAENDHDGRRLAVLYRCLFLGEFPYLKDSLMEAVGEIVPERKGKKR